MLELLPPRKYERKPSPERIAHYLYKMIIRKDTNAEDQRDRIDAEVEIIRRLSRKVYKKLIRHKRLVKDFEECVCRFVKIVGKGGLP